MTCPYCGATLVVRHDEEGIPFMECCGCYATFGVLLNEDECPKCGRAFAEKDTYCLQCGHIRNDFSKKGGY